MVYLDFEAFLRSYDARRLFGIYIETETRWHGATFARDYSRVRADYADYTKMVRSTPEKHRRPRAGQTQADVQMDVDLTILYEGAIHQRWQDDTHGPLMSIVAFHLAERSMLENDVTPSDVLGAKLSMWMDDDDYVNGQVELALPVEGKVLVRDGQHRVITCRRLH